MHITHDMEHAMPQILTKLRFIVPSIFLFLLQIGIPERAIGQEQDSLLFGKWASYKFVGSPCKDLISSIRYSFYPDGKYEIDSRMKRFSGISHETAVGIYSIRQGMIVGEVDGSKIGPFRYRFEGRHLVINNGNPACEIFLRMEEEF